MCSCVYFSCYWTPAFLLREINKVSINQSINQSNTMSLCLFAHSRNPILEPRGGSPAEGADGGEEEPACQRHRDAVLHLPVLFQRPCSCSRGAQRIHQQGCVGVGTHFLASSVVVVVARCLCCDRECWVLPPARRLRASSAARRRPWTWIRALGNFSDLLGLWHEWCLGEASHTCAGFVFLRSPPIDVDPFHWSPGFSGSWSIRRSTGSKYPPFIFTTVCR